VWDCALHRGQERDESYDISPFADDHLLSVLLAS
jgi:hypothetical protein